MMEILTLGEKIRRQRKSLRLTLKDVAGDSVTPAQLSYVESNKCKPSSSLLKYICDKINLDINYALESETVQADKYCSQYLEEYKTYKASGNVNAAEKKLLDIENISSRYEIDSYLAFTKFEKGLNALEKDNLYISWNNFLMALQLFMKKDDYINIVNCCRFIGEIAYKRGSVYEALDYYHMCMNNINEYKLYENINITEILLDLAEVYHSMGKNEECWKYTSELLNEASMRYTTEDFTTILIKTSSMVSDEDNFKIYCGYLSDAVYILTKNGYMDKVLELNVLLNMLYMKMGHIDKVMYFFHDNAEKLSRREDISINISLLKAAYYAVVYGNRDYSKKLLDLVNASILPPKYVGYFLCIKTLCCEETDIEKKEEYLYESLSYVDENISVELLFNINMMFSNLYAENGKYERAIYHSAKCINILGLENLFDYSVNI